MHCRRSKKEQKARNRPLSVPPIRSASASGWDPITNQQFGRKHTSISWVRFPTSICFSLNARLLREKENTLVSQWPEQTKLLTTNTFSLHVDDFSIYITEPLCLLRVNTGLLLGYLSLYFRDKPVSLSCTTPTHKCHDSQRPSSGHSRGHCMSDGQLSVR